MKTLYIIASNLRNPSTGGLIWMSKLGQYAKSRYKKTKLIDLVNANSFVKTNRLFAFIYYFFYLLVADPGVAFVDHSLHKRFGFPIIIGWRLKGNSYAVICHHVFFAIVKNPFRRMVSYVSEKIFLKCAEIIIVPSNKTAGDVQTMGIDRRRIKVVNPTLAIRNRIRPGRKIGNKLLSVGNIEPRKGIDIVIKSLSYIKDFGFSYDIIGDYEKDRDYYNYVRQMVVGFGLSDKVIFHGRIDHLRLFDLYRAADILMFPSRHEGYGMVLLEAMSFGLPIIATDIPTTREIIKDDENGFLCPVDDARCISERIRAIFSDRYRQEKMSVTNFMTSRKFRDWNTVIIETFGILYKILKR